MVQINGVNKDKHMSDDVVLIIRKYRKLIRNAINMMKIGSKIVNSASLPFIVSSSMKWFGASVHIFIEASAILLFCICS